MISAGRVLIMPKGEYDATATYGMLDLVSYNGSSYVAKKSTTGNLPTNTTYWQLSAYGGNASNMAANFAPIETTDYATRAYSAGDYLVNKSGQFCKVTDSIAIGDELDASNTEVTSVEEVIEDLTTYIDGLDDEDTKLTGKTAIAVQTDLHSLGIGNYYKTNTSVYVTNAPTGIASVPTATFKLTVENTTNAVGDTTKLLTLRTYDGKTYTQAYDGASWSNWKLLGDNADVPTYIGATSVAAGVKGLVPAASAGDNDKFFKGDGTFEALGTAAYKDSTDTITEDSTDLIESGAVYDEFDTVNTLIQTLTNYQEVNVSSLFSVGIIKNPKKDGAKHVHWDIHFTGVGDVVTTANTFVKIGTVPDSLKPTVTLYIPIASNTLTSEDFYFGIMRIKPDGDVHVSIKQTAAWQVIGCVEYLTAN